MTDRKKKKMAISRTMRKLSEYIASAGRRALSPSVKDRTRLHLLDTLAAMVSGSRLLPGKIAISYVSSRPGSGEAGIVGSTLFTSASEAAFANAMCAQADETDDSHQPSNTHPGCAVVPAALAMAERERSTGADFLKAVALGYDINSRFTLALGAMAFRDAGHCNHSFGGLFGAASAAGMLAGLNASQTRHVLSYASQQVSGLHTYERDNDHILKSFIFAGMPARNGVESAMMVQHGFTGVDDEFYGEHNRNLFDAYAPGSDPAAMVEGLGKRHEILRASIKKWSVSSQIQAALDSLARLMTEHALKASDVRELVVTLPDNEASTVDSTTMPATCVQHLLGVMLIDGTVTFASSHDDKRMRDPAILALRGRMRLVASAQLTKARPRRQAIVEVITNAGRRLKRRTSAVRGTADNPMERPEIEAKALDLMAPVLGKRRAGALLELVWNIESLADMRKLRPAYRV